MVYVMMFVSASIGFAFSVLDELPDIQHSLLYQFEIPLFGHQGWGFVLLLAGVLAIIGLRFGYDHLVTSGAMTGFVMWTFAAITYFTNEFWYALVTFALFHMVFQAYVFLATSLGYIRRTPLDRY
jgi:hypothetical protein